jgi:hypothetical protein
MKASGGEDEDSDDRAGMGLGFIVAWGSGREKLGLFVLGLLRCA